MHRGDFKDRDVSQASTDSLPMYTFVLGYDGGESDSDEDILGLDTHLSSGLDKKSEAADNPNELRLPPQSEHSDFHRHAFDKESRTSSVPDGSSNSPVSESEGNLSTMSGETGDSPILSNYSDTTTSTEKDTNTAQVSHVPGHKTLSKTKIIHIDIPSTVPSVSSLTLSDGNIDCESEKSLESKISQNGNSFNEPVLGQIVNRVDVSPCNSTCTAPINNVKDRQSAALTPGLFERIMQIGTSLVPDQKMHSTEKTSVGDIITENRHLGFPSNDETWAKSISTGFAQSQHPTTESTITSSSLSGQIRTASSETLFERMSKQFDSDYSTSCRNSKESRFTQQDRIDDRQGLENLGESCTKTQWERNGGVYKKRFRSVDKSRKNLIEETMVISSKPDQSSFESAQQKSNLHREKRSVHINLFKDFEETMLDSSKHDQSSAEGSQKRSKTHKEKASVQTNLFKDFKEVSSAKCKDNQQTCKTIPTMNGDVIDFTAFSWPTQSQMSRRLLCHEVDGRLKVVKGSEQDAKYSRPSKISLCRFVPVYKMYPCINFHSKDPRMTVRSAKSYKDDFREGTKRTSPANKEKINLSQGLFSKFLPSDDGLCDSDANVRTLQLNGNERRNSHSLSLSDREKEDTWTRNSIPPLQKKVVICQNDPLSPSDNDSSTPNPQSVTLRESCEMKVDRKRRIKKRKSHDKSSSKQKHPEKCVASISGENSDETTVYHNGKRKCVGLHKTPLPRSLNTASYDKKAIHCDEKQEKRSDLNLNSKDQFHVHKAPSKASRKQFYQRTCRTDDRRNVLDYHLCSRCMIDKSVVILKPPPLKVKSSACLKCSKQLNVKDLMCKFCKQCFPNLMTYCGHVYNLGTFHPSFKECKHYVCCRCKRAFPSRFLFHEHLAHSKCTRFCFQCESIFPSRSSVEEHVCEKRKCV